MIPIYEQGSGKGIGHGIESFLKRFEEIAYSHINEGRAKSLAFIFYDYHDRDFKKLLKDQGVFTKLDRLSGNELSVFYLHSGSDNLLKKFNQRLLSALRIEPKPETPFIVFCKAASQGFTDIRIATLDSSDLIHGFNELYQVIESYINGIDIVFEPKYIGWLKSSWNFVSIESIRALIAALITIGIS